MELNDWKKGIENHIPAFELFLKNVLVRKCDVTLADVAEGTAEDAADMLQDAGLVVRTGEEHFETEIFFGYDRGWKSVLPREILNLDEVADDEIMNDLFREFTSHFCAMIRGSFREVEIDLQISEPAPVKSGQLSRSLHSEAYFTAILEVANTFLIGDEEQDEPLRLAIALGKPDAEKVAEVQGNPFEADDYNEIIARHAAQIDLKRVERQRPNGSEQGKIHSQNKDVEFEEFKRSEAAKSDREARNIDILKNVEMDLSVELGRRNMPLGEILKLVKGSVIELEKLSGEPVEILINGHKIARGDVVVIDEHFGVRISELLTTEEHIRDLG